MLFTHISISTQAPESGAENCERNGGKVWFMENFHPQSNMSNLKHDSCFFFFFFISNVKCHGKSMCPCISPSRRQVGSTIDVCFVSPAAPVFPYSTNLSGFNN